MQTTGKKAITRVLGLTYAPCMDTYTNKPESITWKGTGLAQDVSPTLAWQFLLYSSFETPVLQDVFHCALASTDQGTIICTPIDSSANRQAKCLLS